MKSKKPGKCISLVEILNISPSGVWLLFNEREYFLSFSQFPWFKNAKIKSIFNVISPSPNHLFWPELDVDLEADSLEFPDQYPLISKEIVEG